MTPDILKFNEDISNAEFEMGLDDGKWGLLDEDLKRPSWPYVILWIKAAPKKGAPDKFYFRFQLDNYPETPPSACPWDIEKNAALAADAWPKGSIIVQSTFNPQWNPQALYAPCDRYAMPNHEQWIEQFPNLWWRENFKIMVYLNFISRLLTSYEYTGQ